MVKTWPRLSQQHSALHSAPPPSPAIINETTVTGIGELETVVRILKRMIAIRRAQREPRMEVEATCPFDYLIATGIGNQEEEAPTASLLLSTPLHRHRDHRQHICGGTQYRYEEAPYTTLSSTPWYLHVAAVDPTNFLALTVSACTSFSIFASFW